jgi:hypothetical protein
VIEMVSIIKNQSPIINSIQHTSGRDRTGVLGFAGPPERFLQN